jgi:ABC-type sugar transport system ATPase subunit
MSALPPPVLAARGLCKSFPGVRALQDVGLELHAGRLLALLGENGAGKSTLMSILAGVTRPDRGDVLVAGQAVHFSSTRQAREQGVVAIFQELSLAGNLTVAENIFLGREPRTRLGTIDYAAMNASARSLLERLGVEIAAETRVSALRVSQQQTVEIARALSTQARVLIMDEPTSALAQREIDSLLRLIGELKRAGVAIIYITHKFEELTGIADDVLIMRDGEVVAARAFAELTHAEIVRFMVGREMQPFALQPNRATADEALRVEELSLPHPTRPGDYIVKDVSLRVARGEVVGLFGLVGAGRTELLETIFGAHSKRARGQVWVAGRRLAGDSAAAIAGGLALAPEDRKHDGLILGLSVRENAGLASTRASTRFGLLSPRQEQSRLEPLFAQLQLKARSPDQAVRNLSGGNQQKVVLAKWLATEPEALLLDEPTRGIDVMAKNEIYALIHMLAGRGLGILLASSELPELLAVCHRVIVLCEGYCTGEFVRGEATAELLMQAALPRTLARRA